MRGATGSVWRLWTWVRGARLVAVPLAVLGLAACGSSSAKYSSSAATTVPAAVTQNKVTTANNSKFGVFLVDGTGDTLYTLTNAGKPVACTGQCATLWPPLLLSAGAATPKSEVGVSGLGTVAMNGGIQVTEHSDPLYRYSGDKAPGDANGEGLQSFGGVWHVIRTGGAAASNAPTTAPPAMMGGYGGYGG